MKIQTPGASNITIISGPARSGKTTALRQAVEQIKNNNRHLFEAAGNISEAHLRRIIKERNPNYVTIDEAAIDVTPLAAEYPEVHFIIVRQTP